MQVPPIVQHLTVDDSSPVDVQFVEGLAARTQDPFSWCHRLNSPTCGYPDQCVIVTTGGYLFLATKDGIGTLRSNHEVQARLGADIHLMERGELSAQFPWLCVDDVHLGAHGRSGEGWSVGSNGAHARKLILKFVRTHIGAGWTRGAS